MAGAVGGAVGGATGGTAGMLIGGLGGLLPPSRPSPSPTPAAGYQASYDATIWFSKSSWTQVESNSDQAIPDDIQGNHRASGPADAQMGSAVANENRAATGCSAARFITASTLKLLIEQHRDPLLPEQTLD